MFGYSYYSDLIQGQSQWLRVVLLIVLNLRSVSLRNELNLRT